MSFVKVAQRVGLSLGEIREALESLPSGRTPNRRDWAKLAKRWRPLLDERIALLESMRAKLDGCIGCGCLSVDACALYNVDDEAATYGTGPRWLLGNSSSRSSRQHLESIVTATARVDRHGNSSSR